MITLYQLRELAKKDNPSDPVDLMRLLESWATNNPKNELSHLLEGTGLEVHRLLSILDALKQGDCTEDKDLFNHAILSNTDGGQIYGWHILKTICDVKGNRFLTAFAQEGFSCKALLDNIEKSLSQKQGTLAGLGINVGEIANPLLQYGRDLTALAGQGEFDFLCDRPAEIERMLEVVLRQKKGNLVLTGEAGVGKTALCELFARMLVKGEPPPQLKGTRIFELSLARVVAGTRYRGDFEERMDAIIQAVQDQEPAILYIDEMHLLWGAGRAENVITDAANILKPFLARGKIRIIGATTATEYQHYIAQDAALARRFQELKLAEPERELTWKMVHAQAGELSMHHQVVISDEVITKAIEFTDRHVPSRFQPDKAIDLLDSCSVSIARADRKEVLVPDLLGVLSKQTGRAISALTGDDRAVLANLAGRLKKHIIGQDHVIKRIVPVLVHRRQDLGAENRNLGTFMFMGGTGVGKTETARVLGREFFGNNDALIHIDLGEYGAEGAVNKLIGAPVGYSGSDREGVLAKGLHAMGSCVILLDEIEKAHPEVRRLILGLLDNGRITTGKGERLDTTQCIVIMTTNALKPDDMKRKTIGFGAGASAVDLEALLADHFPREFIGRLDDAILFNTLSDKDMKDIIRLRLTEAFNKLSCRAITIACDLERLSRFLLPISENTETFARGVQRVVEQKVLQPLSMALLYQDGNRAVTVELGDRFYQTGEIEIL